MLALVIVLLPLLFAGLIFLAGANLSRTLAMAGGISQLILTLVCIVIFKQGDPNQLLAFKQDWIGPLGMSYNFSLDGTSLVMSLLTGLVLPLIIYSSFNKAFKNPHIFYGLMLLMAGAMQGAFTTSDGLFFYIFYEFALIPIYFIILIWGSGENRAKVTMKFFLYTLFGSLFMLIALLYVYQQAGSFKLARLYEAGQAMSGIEQAWVFAGFFIAFAVKIPIFPLHTWQPSTYDAAPTAGTMMLGGIMLKMATFGLIRLVLPMVPVGVADYGSWALGLCAISVVYASLMALNQKRYKLLIAYSSIAHVGLLAAGILSNNAQGIQGGLFEMISHGILTVGMFFVFDIIESRLGHDDMKKMGGIRDVNPLFAFLFFVLVMGSVALPITSGFVGEFLLLIGLNQYSTALVVVGGLTVVLGAVYMLRAFQLMMLGPANGNTSGFSPLTTHEKTVLILVVVLVLGLGIYPAPILELSEPAVQNILLGIF